MISPHLLPKIRSAKLMDEIGGKYDVPLPCTLRIASLVPGGRCAPRDTVVGAHCGNLGKGTATKVSDMNVVAACHTCHALLDRVGPGWERMWSQHEAQVLRRVISALNETHAHLIMRDIITVRGAIII